LLSLTLKPLASVPEWTASRIPWNGGTLERDMAEPLLGVCDRLGDRVAWTGIWSDEIIGQGSVVICFNFYVFLVIFFVIPPHGMGPLHIDAATHLLSLP